MKLIVSDLDGTLLDGESRVNDRTVAALRQAAEAGVHVAAATGRSHRTAAELLRPVGVIRWAICSNGATLYDVENDAVLSHTFLDTASARSIIEATTEYPGLGLAWETPAGLFRDETMHAQMTNRYGPNIWAIDGEPPIHEVSDRVIKVMMGHPDFSHDDLVETMGPRLGASVVVTSSGAEFIEVTHTSAEKGLAVSRLCTDLGVDQADTVAFGDQLNDLGMLQWVERGYAMANAHPRLKAVTDLRAPHHDADGVASVVENLVADLA